MPRLAENNMSAFEITTFLITPSFLPGLSSMIVFYILPSPICRQTKIVEYNGVTEAHLQVAGAVYSARVCRGYPLQGAVEPRNKAKVVHCDRLRPYFEPNPNANFPGI